MHFVQIQLPVFHLDTAEQERDSEIWLISPWVNIQGLALEKDSDRTPLTPCPMHITEHMHTHTPTHTSRESWVLNGRPRLAV